MHTKHEPQDNIPLPRSLCSCPLSFSFLFIHFFCLLFVKEHLMVGAKCFMPARQRPPAVGGLLVQRGLKVRVHSPRSRKVQSRLWQDQKLVWSKHDGILLSSASHGNLKKEKKKKKATSKTENLNLNKFSPHLAVSLTHAHTHHHLPLGCLSQCKSRVPCTQYFRCARRLGAPDVTPAPSFVVPVKDA
mgnify:CR=1 FL=1